MHPLINVAITAARNASKVILQSLEHVDTHGLNDNHRHELTRNVSQAALDEILLVINNAHPDHHVCTKQHGHNAVENGKPTWYVTAIDGFINYMHDFPQFSVSLALKENNKWQHAVIYDPIRNEIFSASRGEGAKLNNRRMRVSQTKKIKEALLGTGFPFSEPQHLKPYLKTFQAILPVSSGIRRAGSSALDLAYLAAGRIDGFWEITANPWVMAAGVLMIQEAGGLVADFTGGENYFDSGNIVAGTPKIFKNLLQILQPVLMDDA